MSKGVESLKLFNQIAAQKDVIFRHRLNNCRITDVIGKEDFDRNAYESVNNGRNLPYSVFFA